MRRERLILLKRLAERYHTLPLNKEELSKICQNARIDPGEVHDVLREAVGKGILRYVIFMGRKLVYLDGIKRAR